MTAMRAVGPLRRLPARASVREEGGEYVIELDVAGFAPSELTVEIVGPHVTVRGDQEGTVEDEQEAFRLHERLEESFRLPDDADATRLRAVHRHGTLELHAPQAPLERRELPIEHAPPLGDSAAEPC